eukprot:NODE_158_length_15065_cov_0.349125.p2 type:complete len:521 gc:universal NODE_158_length_15065_cov_0.349125:3782-5344(+)
MSQIFQIAFALSLLLFLTIINYQSTTHHSMEMELPTIKPPLCPFIKNAFSFHFPDLNYYQHEPYSNIHMQPTHEPHTMTMALRQPLIRAQMQFTALLPKEMPFECHFNPLNMTSKVSIWNSHHHERIFTAVITCELHILLVNATMKINNDVVKYTFDEEYEMPEHVMTFNDLIKLTEMHLNDCLIEIPKLPMTTYHFLIHQIFPYKVVEHSIKSPFIHDISICMSPLRGLIPYLAEFFEYYLLMGIDHFYIYNHELVPETLNLIQFYVDRGLATLIEWEADRKGWYFYQAAANNECIFNYRHYSKYLMFVDPDEFIKLENMDLKQLLRQFEKNSRFDILVEIEFLNWFYSTQIDVKYQQQHMSLDIQSIHGYKQVIEKSLIHASSNSVTNTKWTRFKSIVTLMSYKLKEPMKNRKKFIAKSMLVHETQIHKALPYHYTRKYELPVEMGYIMHFRELNGGQFGSKYAEMKDYMKIIQHVDNLESFELGNIKTLEHTWLFSKRKTLMERLMAVQQAYTKWVQ